MKWIWFQSVWHFLNGSLYIGCLKFICCVLKLVAKICLSAHHFSNLIRVDSRELKIILLNFKRSPARSLFRPFLQRRLWHVFELTLPNQKSSQKQNTKFGWHLPCFLVSKKFFWCGKNSDRSFDYTLNARVCVCVKIALYSGNNKKNTCEMM